MQQWFRQLVDVPQIFYKGNPEIRRTELPDYNVKPEISHFNIGNKQHVSLSWPIQNGSTSASPAQRWITKSRIGETISQTALRQLHEALELPGTLSDYHFLIQSCSDKLWQQRREEHWVYPVIEDLCWLDIHLVEKYPDIITYEDQEGMHHFYAVAAFKRLIDMYSREGFMREALAIAQRAACLGNCHSQQLETYQAQVLELDAEGVN